MEQMNETENSRFPQNTGDTNIFDNLKPLPVYYSEKAIYGFSVLMGILFGSILMAMNLNNTPAKKGVWQVLAFGVSYTALELLVLSRFSNAYTSLTIAFNIAGALVLNRLLLEKFIGKGIEYTNRSILIPAIIATVFAALVIGSALLVYRSV